MFTRLFLEHPRSIGESYLEHQRCALGFGVSLVLAGLACIVHALVPGLFVRTGSDEVTRLHGLMLARRARTAGGPEGSRGRSGETPMAPMGPDQGAPSSLSAQRRFT